MTPEAQRIAIAEAYGLKELHYLSGQLCYDLIHSYPVPDYLGSLDAMHKVEAAMDPAIRSHAYRRELEAIRPVDTFCATAAERAKAFILTFNLWDDTK